MTFKTVYLGTGSLFFLLSVPLSTLSADSNPTMLAPVTVVGVAVDQMTGKSTLSAEQIKRLPQGNGSLNELLTVMPSVQAGDLTNNSLQGGEIVPPNISITGGKVYDNNFMVDGIGNNSMLDPAADNPEAINDLPGYPQELFLDADLIENVTVYRSNIPVEFGGFVGGVVDADTSMPESEFSGKINLRTTRSNWTRFHLDDTDEDDFTDSSSVDRQPHFEKYNGGISLNVPLNENTGLLISYRKIYSKIPLRHFEQKREQSRELETYFLKFTHEVSERTAVSLTFVQTPYQEERFREKGQGSEIKNSWYTLDNDSYRLLAETGHFFDFGKLEIIGALQKSEYLRYAPSKFFNWRAQPSNWEGYWSKNWGTRSQSKEGGYGDLEATQESQSLNVSLELEPLSTGPVSHEVKLGYGFERVTGTFERKETSYVYTVVKAGIDTDITCQGDVSCVDGEQYASYRSVYTQDSIDETINSHHAYVQDNLRYGRLTLRPGLRFSIDNFFDNDDLDMRLAASVDLFGSGNTLLIGGINRYHSRPLLAYKLAEAKRPVFTERRSKNTETNTLTPWTLVTQSKSLKKYSTLNTPYSDELTVGIDQTLLGGRLNLNYIERRNKDEFAQETSKKNDEGLYFTTLNNNGRSKHEEVSVEWERNWKKHYLAINATWQQTETSNDSYRVSLKDEDLIEQVYYHGELMKKIDLPREDYNRPYVANLIYSATLPYGFVFTNTTRYRSGYEDLEDCGEEQPGPDGEDLAIYEKVKQPESWIFDWRLDWRRDLYRTQGIQLSLEVNNVFNQKVAAGTETSIQTYEMGRQIWAGMDYSF